MQTRQSIRWAVAAVLAAVGDPPGRVQRLEQRQGRRSRPAPSRACSRWRTRTKARRRTQLDSWAEEVRAALGRDARDPVHELLAPRRATVRGRDARGRRGREGRHGLGRRPRLRHGRRDELPGARSLRCSSTATTSRARSSRKGSPNGCWRASPSWISSGSACSRARCERCSACPSRSSAPGTSRARWSGSRIRPSPTHTARARRHARSRALFGGARRARRLRATARSRSRATSTTEARST